MPRIELKPNSPEYKDKKSSCGAAMRCDFRECEAPGEFKAPKSRQCDDYYHFCLLHVKAYNASWDYFDGMTPLQVEQEMLRSLYGDRPTWRHEGTDDPADALRKKAWQTYNNTDEDPTGPSEEERKRRSTAFAYHHDSDEYKAMALLGLEPPLDLDILKKRYKELAKKHHPDRHKGCSKAEDLLKEINIAYTILKEAFEKYEKMIDKGF